MDPNPQQESDRPSNDANFDPRVIERLSATVEDMQLHGQLLARDEVLKVSANFRERFGPQALARLDGDALLETMHGRGKDNDSLMYWLEFKNDDEFPASLGSIAGGNALKFGIYRRKDTNQWMTGSAQKQKVITQAEAIEFARDQREQLRRGAAEIERLSVNASLDEYRELQQRLDEVAPAVSNSSWGHKYFFVLYPDKLDDFHSPSYQRNYIARLLQEPPEGEGRYVAAWHFTSLARQLQTTTNSATTAIMSTLGPMRSYYRIGTTHGDTEQSEWDAMRDGGYVSIGWDKLGDLTEFLKRDIAEVVDALTLRLNEHYPNSPQAIGRLARQVVRFFRTIATGDIVVAMNGMDVLGIGRVIGDYEFKAGERFPHCRSVEWLSFDNWPFPVAEGLRTTVYELGKQGQNLAAIERHCFSAEPHPPQLKDDGVTLPKIIRPGVIPPLTGIAGRIQSVLKRKSQVILYGPPGTGKTWHAYRAARDLAAFDSFGTPFDQLSNDQKQVLIGDGASELGRVRFCSFHPAYGYEDFIEGYRPQGQTQPQGSMSFELRSGIFKQLCQDATHEREHQFFLIIDEINRGDVPRIFGELMTVIEESKRGQSILLPLSGQPFHVPKNVFVIGTMNTADRSIALLDTALRRRFGFIELMPDTRLLNASIEGEFPLGLWLEALNDRIQKHLGGDARNRQIGHSYFLQGERPITSLKDFAHVIQDDVVPLLEEYCYEDHSLLGKILGPDFVDAERQLIRHELFEPGRRQELIQSLLAPCPEITKTLEATAHKASILEGENAGDDSSEAEPE